jgi:allantoinase
MMPPQMDLVIRATRAVVDGEVQPIAVGITDGLICAIGPMSADYLAAEEARLPPSAVLMPGLVDTHVHINEPGTDWEGFATATAAAAAGGITTLVDMPLDCDPVTTTPTALAAKRDAARNTCRVDVGFWAGVIPDNIDVIDELAAAGALGFKCFLADSGNPRFPHLTPTQFRRAMARIADIGAVLLVHAESDHVVAASPRPDGREYASFLRSRPDAAEEDAVALVIETVRATGARAHIVHVSSARVLPMLSAAKQAGLPITAETCPHYLTFAAEEIPDGATEFAACPPIRSEDNRSRLWDGLRDGTLDMIVSDHSPCAPYLKASGDFSAAWGGIGSLELGPRAVWTQAQQRGFGLPDLCRWMAERPAVLAGLSDRGRITLGHTANLCAIEPDIEKVVHAEALNQRHPITPYDGLALRGSIVATWLRGRPVNSRTRGGLLTAAVSADQMRQPV